MTTIKVIFLLMKESKEVFRIECTDENDKEILIKNFHVKDYQKYNKYFNPEENAKIKETYADYEEEFKEFIYKYKTLITFSGFAHYFDKNKINIKTCSLKSLTDNIILKEHVINNTVTPEFKISGSVVDKETYKVSVIDEERKNIYIYSSPFSNFSKFEFYLFGRYFPTLEHLIMYIRLYYFTDDSEEEVYNFISKPFPFTAAMKQAVKHRCKNISLSEYSFNLLSHCTESIFVYALYRKIKSGTIIHNFFLTHKDYKFYECSTHSPSWSIPIDLDLENFNLDKLYEASKEKDCNLFGIYLDKANELIHSGRDDKEIEKKLLGEKSDWFK